MGKSQGSSIETQANHLSSRQKENRGSAKGTVGEVEGAAEECVESAEPAASMRQAFVQQRKIGDVSRFVRQP